MAAISKHPADVLIWLEKVLESCETQSQLKTCNELLFNFKKNYLNYLNNRYHPYLNKLHELQKRIWDKWDKLEKK